MRRSATIPAVTAGSGISTVSSTWWSTMSSQGGGPMNTDRIGRAEARRLAEDEFQRFAELAAALTPQEWAMPTDCTAWDVRKIALHVLGSADAQASVGEFA